MTATTALTLPRRRSPHVAAAPGLLPVRPTDPPYDDELAPDGRADPAVRPHPPGRSLPGRPGRATTPTAPREVTSGTRRLAERGAVLARPPEQPSIPLLRHRGAGTSRRLLSGPDRLGSSAARSGRQEAGGAAEAGPPAQPRKPPDPRRTAAVVVRLVVEVLAGARPMAHLAPWTTAALQHDLQRTASVLTNRQPSQVRSVRVSEPLPGIAEVSAVVSRGPRMRAMALRMELAADRWQVTTLQLG
ncbi:Rv3235 family protein [Parafrankia sp. FMc2]|uniref:Rv3235 family protein n=1 Tax=Parafrankia sp. FMc2 TaxID=3233196 RepID=UPI0034D684EE